MLLSFLEELICKLPSVWYNLSKTLLTLINLTHISICIVYIKLPVLLKHHEELEKTIHICVEQYVHIHVKYKDKRITHTYTYIGVELADKAREVVMLEVIRKKVTSELGRTPNNEGCIIFTPRDNMVSSWVINELVSFSKKWSWNRFV